MKFSKKNKLAILLLLGIGIAGFILGFISPRITLLNSEAAGWGKPQANIENKEVKLGIYDVLFVDYEPEVPSDDLNRLTLKLLLNISNPFEDTGLIIPRLDITIGHLGKPAARIWTLSEFRLDPFDVNENVVGDSIEDQLAKRNDTNSAGLWQVYLSIYTGEGSGINKLFLDLFKGELGTISFEANIELGNYPISVEGIFGELLKLVGLGLGGTETGSITDEPIPDLLANALGAELDTIIPAVRTDTIFIKVTNTSGDVDVRTLTENVNVSVLNNENESIYFGGKSQFSAIYIANSEAYFVYDGGIYNDTLVKTVANNVTVSKVSAGLTSEIMVLNMSESIISDYVDQMFDQEGIVNRDIGDVLFVNATLSNSTFAENVTLSDLDNDGYWTLSVDSATNLSIPLAMGDYDLYITFFETETENTTLSFGNTALGDGSYVWEYYNGTQWNEFLPADIDNTLADFAYNETADWQSGYVNFSIPDDWAKLKVADFFSAEYYFVRCGVLNQDSANLDSTNGAIKVNIKYSRIGTDIPDSPPVSEDGTVFGEGGMILGESVILADEEPIIVYPGINPENLPEIPGLLQYGEGDFDEYLIDVLGLNLEDLLTQADLYNKIFDAVEYISITDNMQFNSEDVPLSKMIAGEIDTARFLYHVFTFLYCHNISTGDFLALTNIDFGGLIDILGNVIPEEEFTTGSKWVDSEYADDESIYEWTEQEHFKDAKNYSWYLFGLLGAVAILSVPYNMKNKEDQSKFLMGSDISNAKDLMEDDTGKTVLVGSVSSMDSEKMRWELLGGFAAIGIGILLYGLKTLAFSDFNDGVIYSFLPSILESLFENSRNLDNNPYSPLVILLTAFVDFPGIFAWFVPALYVSYLRNKQFSNIKKRRVGWDVFWKGAYMIELVLAIMCIGLGIATLMGDQDFISYFAGGLIFIVFLFITPYFYFAIGIAGLGGFIGSRLALKKPGESEVTFTEEYLAKGDDYVGTSDYDEYAEYEEDEYEEYEDTDRTEIVDFDSQGEVVGMVCKYCWETYPVGTDSCGKCGNTDLSQAIECPKCGNMIPIDAKFCNECGSQL
jgi:hypothetical protein